jgi:hypothetical protein
MKSKAKTEDLLALLNSGFIREKEVDMWRAAAGDPYPMEKNEDEIPMSARFAERGLSLLASNFFKGLMGYYGIEYLNLNPNSIFHTAVFVHFCKAFLGIKPHWILFRKFFRVKPQPSASNPRVVGGAGIQMRENNAEQYLSYKLIDSNQDWKAKWFYITNHHLGLPKPRGKHPKHRTWWNTEPTMHVVEHLGNVCGSCHQTATPLPHPASSQCKPCDPAACPPPRSFPTRPDPISVVLGPRTWF